MRRRRSWILPLAGAAIACQAESAPIATGSPPAGPGPHVVRVSELIAGPEKTSASIRNPYEDNKQVLVDGKRYYNWFNCTGCHGGAGGGGIGPPLADDDWIYGGEAANIFLSIVQGRPNGMPSYGGQLSDDQVWKIAAYVKTLSGEAGAKGATADESSGEEQGRGQGGSLERGSQDRRAGQGGTGDP